MAAPPPSLRRYGASGGDFSFGSVDSMEEMISMGDDDTRTDIDNSNIDSNGKNIGISVDGVGNGNNNNNNVNGDDESKALTPLYGVRSTRNLLSSRVNSLEEEHMKLP